MPTSARSLASSFSSSGSATPSISIVPDSNVSSRLIVRQRVDLPEPEGPMTTTTSPSPIVRSMSLRTCSSPKCLLTLLNTTKGRCIVAGESAGLSSLGVSVIPTHTSRAARRPELWLLWPRFGRPTRMTEIAGAADPQQPSGRGAGMGLLYGEF